MSSRLAAHSHCLTDTGKTVESCNGIMRRQFHCLWIVSVQGEDGKQYWHDLFDTTLSLSLAPQKWIGRMITTIMAVNIVTFLLLFQELQSISTPCELSLK